MRDVFALGADTEGDSALEFPDGTVLRLNDIHPSRADRRFVRRVFCAPRSAVLRGQSSTACRRTRPRARQRAAHRVGGGGGGGDPGGGDPDPDVHHDHVAHHGGHLQRHGDVHRA